MPELSPEKVMSMMFHLLLWTRWIIFENPGASSEDALKTKVWQGEAFHQNLNNSQKSMDMTFSGLNSGIFHLFHSDRLRNFESGSNKFSALTNDQAARAFLRTNVAQLKLEANYEN